MEATISWRVTVPLRWLSRQRSVVRDRCVRPLRTAAASMVHVGISAAKRSALYSHVAPWLQSRYPRLWKRARSLRIAVSPVTPFTAAPWEPRTTRDATIIKVAEVERQLTVEIRQRRRS
jgi:hypothetical protein